MLPSLADIDTSRLSGRARETLARIAPVVAEGASYEDAGAQLGLSRRDVAEAMREVRFQLDAQQHGARLPELAHDDYEALKESIREHGQRIPILASPTGEILDGNHRLRACQELNLKPWIVAIADVTDGEELRSIAIAVNVARRQLSAGDKRKVVEAELIKTPRASDRAVAIRVGVSHPTVSKVRAELIERGKVERLSTRVGTNDVEQPLREPEPPSDVAVTLRVRPVIAHLWRKGAVRLLVLPVTEELYDEFVSGEWSDPVRVKAERVEADEHEISFQREQA